MQSRALKWLTKWNLGPKRLSSGAVSECPACFSLQASLHLLLLNSRRLLSEACGFFAERISHGCAESNGSVHRLMAQTLPNLPAHQRYYNPFESGHPRTLSWASAQSPILADVGASGFGAHSPTTSSNSFHSRHLANHGASAQPIPTALFHQPFGPHHWSLGSKADARTFLQARPFQTAAENNQAGLRGWLNSVWGGAPKSQVSLGQESQVSDKGDHDSAVRKGSCTESGVVPPAVIEGTDEGSETSEKGDQIVDGQGVPKDGKRKAVDHAPADMSKEQVSAVRQLLEESKVKAARPIIGNKYMFAEHVKQIFERNKRIQGELATALARKSAVLESVQRVDQILGLVQQKGGEDVEVPGEKSKTQHQQMDEEAATIFQGGGDNQGKERKPSSDAEYWERASKRKRPWDSVISRGRFEDRGEGGESEKGLLCPSTAPQESSEEGGDRGRGGQDGGDGTPAGGFSFVVGPKEHGLTDGLIPKAAWFVLKRLREKGERVLFGGACPHPQGHLNLGARTGGGY